MKSKASGRLLCILCICNSMAALESRSRSPLTSILPGRVVCSEEMLLVFASHFPARVLRLRRSDLDKADAGEQKFPFLACRPKSRL